MGNKYLLIGGAGFIGQSLAEKLVKAKCDVTILDYIEKTEQIKKNNSIKYIQVNYFLGEVERDIIKEYNTIVLLACSVGPKTSMENPEVCYGKDIIQLIDLLEKMRDCSVKRLVFISSGGTVYGDHADEYLKEEVETKPLNHYGIMKLTQEKILIMYNNLYNMNNVIFRIANPYGPGQRIESGIGAVTAFVHNVMWGKTIHIWGNGDAVRDYIYIDDVAELVCRFLEMEFTYIKNPVYNIGTGRGTSLIELIKIIEKVIGIKAKVEYEVDRGIDVHRNVLDISKILDAIGDYSCMTIEEGIKKYYGYICKEDIFYE